MPHSLEKPVEPSHGHSAARKLTLEEVLPIAVALEHRRRQKQRGQQIILTPLPRCPQCGTGPTETIAEELYRLQLMWRIAFLPCGHRFDVPVAVSDEAARRAQPIVDHEEQRPVAALPTTRPTPAAITVKVANLPDVIALVEQLTGERDQARRIAVELEQRNARALEALEQEDTSGWFSPEALKDTVDKAKETLRGSEALGTQEPPA